MNASNDPSPSTAWWATPPSTWSDVAEATFAAWRDEQTSKITLDSDVARTAMAFGFGARAAYADEPEWANLLAPLEADWLASGREGDYPWHFVHQAAKAGWTAAALVPAAPEGDAAVEIAFVADAPEEAALVEVAPAAAPRKKAARLAAAEVEAAEAVEAPSVDASEGSAAESNDPPAPPERNVPGGRPDADNSAQVVAQPEPPSEPHVPGGRPDRP